MEKIIKARVITPIFISGSNQKEAEMRAPSIKGVLRFWFRAGFGEFSDKMIEKEEKIFGSKEKPCVFQIRTTQLNSDTFNPLSYRGYPGISYFLPFLKGRKVIPEKTEFDISLKFYKEAEDNHIKAVFGSLWLLFWLGAIGSRARRGFGSILPEKILFPENMEIQGLNFLPKKKDINGLEEFLKENLNKAIKIINNPDKTNISGLPNYTLLSKQNTKIYLWKKPFDSWQKTIDEAGRLLMDWRKKQNPDYQQIKVFLRNDIQPTKLKRPAFGLPIQFYYRSIEKVHLFNLIKKELPNKSNKEIKQILSLGKRGIQNELKIRGLREDKIKNLFKKARQLATAYVGGKRAKEGEYTRRSSPLFIKVIKLSDNNYALLFIFMKAKLFPGKIKVEKEGRETSVNPPDFSMVEEFLEQKVKKEAFEIW